MRKIVGSIIVIIMLVTMATPVFASPFTDVNDTHWAASAIEQLTAIGVLNGYPDGTFRGSNNITRYEVSVALSKLLTYVEGLIKDIETQTSVSSIAGVPTQTSDELKQLQALINELIKGQDQLKAENANLQSQIDALKGLPTQSTTSHVDLQLANDISALNNKINDIDKKASSGNYAVALTNDDIAILNSRVEGINKTIADANEKNTTIDQKTYNDLLDIYLKLSNMEDQLSKTASSDESKALGTQVASLNEKVIYILNNAPIKDNIENDIVVLNARIIELQSKIATLSQATTNSASMDNINALNAKIAELENAMTSLNIKTSDADGVLNNNISALTKKMDDLSAYVASLKVANGEVSSDPKVYNELLAQSGRISALEAKVNALSNSQTDPKVTNDIAALSGRVAALESKAAVTPVVQVDSSVKNDIASISGRLAAIETKLAIQPTVSAVNTNDLAALSGRLAAVESKLSVQPTAQTNYSNDIAALSGRLAAIETKMSAQTTSSTTNYSNDIAALSGRLAALETKLSVAPTTSTSNTSDYVALSGRVAALETKLSVPAASTSSTSEIAALSGRLAALETKLSVSPTTSTSSASDYTALSGRVAALETKLSVQPATSTSNTSDITALSGRLAALEAKIDTLPATQANTALTSDLAAQSGRISALEAKLATAPAGSNQTDVIAASSITLNAEAQKEINTLTLKVAELEKKIALINTTSGVVTAGTTTAASTNVLKNYIGINAGYINEKLSGWVTWEGYVIPKMQISVSAGVQNYFATTPDMFAITAKVGVKNTFFSFPLNNNIGTLNFGLNSLVVSGKFPLRSTVDPMRIDFRLGFFADLTFTNKLRIYADLLIPHLAVKLNIAKSVKFNANPVALLGVEIPVTENFMVRGEVGYNYFYNDGFSWNIGLGYKF